MSSAALFTILTTFRTFYLMLPIEKEFKLAQFSNKLLLKQNK